MQKNPDRAPGFRKSLMAFAVAGWLCGLTLATAQEKGGGAADKQPTAGRLTFEEHVWPLLQARCLKCHGNGPRKAGLDLRRRFSIVKGGDNGPAVVPGKPDKSLLMEMVATGQMPPEDEGQLVAKHIDLLRRWIAGGARTKHAKEPPLKDETTDREISARDREFWAFQPPQRPKIPAVKSADRVRTPIDAFLLAALEDKGGSFNLDAEKAVLIRRLYFDLLGLPPSPREIAAFLDDDRTGAYERMVDRLLASPRYGERWGRHWLDVAGYADSDGYLEADRLRPEAWRYRDYVIRALNEDKPYDRFVLEQIAGDELADWRRAKKLTPELADNLVATGFLRTALDATYGNYAEPLECHKVMADTIQIVSSAFVGLTVQCARCHAHKFDPISQRDYYRLHAVLLSSYDPQRWIVSLSRSIPMATEAERAEIASHNRAIDDEVKQIAGKIASLFDEYRNRRLSHVADPSLRDKLKAALVIEPKKRKPAQNKLIQEHADGKDLSEKALREKYAEFATRLDRLKASAAAEMARKKSIVPLRGLADLDGKPRQAHVLVRGDFNTRGKPVEPGAPAVLSAEDSAFKPLPGYKTSGRRRALAQWLVDKRNPLTARVHVNRIWAQHFGRGIVASLDNFGKTGARPSHPQLLDWLATEFVASGWSQKHLHRLILTSTAYRQSSEPNLVLRSIDDENVLLGSWPPQRHEGEVVRDAVLHAAGKLNRRMYGRPVPVKRHADGRVTVANTPAGHRASIYLIVRRSQPVTLLELLDTPRMEVNCPQRVESAVVTHSLSMLNSEFMETAAKDLAARLLERNPADENARLDAAYQHLFCRKPRPGERRSIAEFLDDVVKAELGTRFDGATEQQRHSARQVAWRNLALVLMNSNEFLFVN